LQFLFNILYTTTMSKNQIIFIIGVLVALMPLSGFPGISKFYFYESAGILLMALTLLPVLKRKILSLSKPKKTISDVFVEKRPEVNSN